MELIKNLTATLLFFLVGCISNPFGEGKPSKKVKIEGYVFANGRVSDASVFVYIEELNVFKYADSSGYFSIDLLNLESEVGNFSGSVRVFYYLHNYKVAYSTLFITNGRLTGSQTDFDEYGTLIEPVILQKLLSLELSINNVWDRSNADSLRFSLTLMSHDEPVSFLSYVNVLSDPRRYVPSGILLKSNQNDAVYFDENDADLIQRTDLNSNDILQLEYNVSPNGFLPFVIDDYISLEQQLVQNGSHLILPYVFIIQENIPQKILSVLSGALKGLLDFFIFDLADLIQTGVKKLIEWFMGLFGFSEDEIKAATGLEYVEATYSENKITLKVNESLIRDWAHSDQVTISSSLDLSSNENLTILIEKDFKCLSPRDEDESDMFPHPKQQ